MICKFEGNKFLVVMYNVGKLIEIFEIFEFYGVIVVGVGEMDLFEFEEIEDIFVGNVWIKVYVVV